MEKFDNAVFETKFNQVAHEIELYLDNSSGASTNQKYPINPNSVVNLTIEDTLADWVVKGTLTFFYNPESGTGQTNKVTGQASSATTGINLPNAQPFYIFRNDGYDLLRIRVKPKLKDTNLPNKLKITDPVHWSLSYYFSIYDMEDIDQPPGAQNQASATIKCIKLYFWDSWYQKMVANNLEYSTALSPYANIEEDKQTGLYGNPGVIPTGQAIREIINLSLGQDSTQKNYSDTTFVDPVLGFNYEPVKTDAWDDGAAKIFYTAPAQTTAYESLMYIHDKHVSTDSYALAPKTSAPRGGTKGSTLNDLSILVKERGPTENDVGQLTLKSVASYFKQAGNSATQPGKYQYEHFFLQSYGDVTAPSTGASNNQSKPTKTLRGPISDKNSDVVDFKSLKYSTITNYRFVDMSALTNTVAFVNTPVHSFDFKNRMFNIEFQNNSVVTARNFMNQKYIKELYKNSRTNSEKLFLINLNKDKQSKSTMPVFTLYGDDPAIIRQHAGLHKLLYVGLFQNTAINFRTLGLSFREPGRFIAIDKTEGVESGDFEDKFYGQWFVVNVKHVFESEIYYNDITAIKIHRFQDPPISFSGTI
jgi:hypothetical protein